MEGASFLQSEPALGPYRTSPSAPYAAVPGLVLMALQLMTNINQMVELMLAGPLAQLCREKGVELYKCFRDPSPPE